MAEIANVYYANAAQAVQKSVSGSDALKATTICMIEMDDGALYMGDATLYDTTDDTARRQAAYASAFSKIPVAAEEQPEPAAAVEVPVEDPAPAVEPTPEVTEEPVAEAAPEATAEVETLTAPAAADTITATAGEDTITADAGADTVAAASGNDTLSAAAGADTLTAPSK